MEESKSISRAPGYYHWVPVTFFIIIIIIIIVIIVIIITIIILFIYLSTFIHAQSVLQRWMGCSADVLGISGDVSVHGCDFIKVAKRLCWDRASVLVFSCGFTSCLGASSVGNTSGGLLLNGYNFIYNFWFILFNKIYFWGF